MQLFRAVMLAALAPGAIAQSTIYGIDFLNGGAFFETSTAGFEANFNQLGASPAPGQIFALDFDQTATTLWGVDNGTFQYGTIDVATGQSNMLGTLNFLTGTVLGLTCSTTGVWYLAEFDGVNTANIYSGDVTTGTFTLVGTTGPNIIPIDIAIDTQGVLYGHDINLDQLVTIDTAIGTATPIGSTGQAANFAQGMDFDWSTNTLYAAVFTGPQGGPNDCNFVTFDTATGNAVVLESLANPLREVELTVAVPVGGNSVGTNVCTSTQNSTGFASTISANGSTSIADDNLVLTADNLPQQPGIFIAGPTQAQIPFFNGFLCVSTNGLQRFLNANTPTNGVVQEVVTIAGSVAGGLNVVAGSPYYYQRWNRDPQGGGGAANFSDAIEILYTP